VLETLQQINRQLDEILRGVDPSALAPADAAQLLDAFVALERAAAAGRVLVADRASLSSWSGFRSPEDWLADKTGSSFLDARNTLNASSKLAELPAVDEALRQGKLSSAQVNQLAPVVNANNEHALLDAARNEDLRGLKKACEREKAKAVSEDDARRRHERIHKERSFRSWTDGEGAYCYEGRTTADEGARIDAAVAAKADEVFRQAQKEGRRETAAAYRSDALVSLVTEGGASVDTTVVIRVDESRLRGEEGICETEAGPVPVDVAIGAILAWAFVKVVVMNGVDVKTVCHPGRHRPAVLETAIVERDGGRCVRPGCSSSHRLEVHHYVTDFARAGPTAYDNLATLCRFDHKLVTTGGHRLTGKPGAWEWIEPP